VVGLLVFDNEAPGSHCHIISARPRRGWDPFVVITAVLRKAVGLSNDELVAITHYGPMRRALGIFDRMVQRVVYKHGGLFVGPAGIDAYVDFVQEIRSTQYPPALDPRNINIVGHAGLSQAVLVGDQINLVYKRFRHWPFHANIGCTVYLAKCLEKIHVEEKHLVYTNINCPEQHVKALHQFNPGLRFVALGNEAACGLDKLGIPFKKVYHPQYAKRFLLRRLEYDRMLEKALF